MAVTLKFSLNEGHLVAVLAEMRDRSINRKPALRSIARAGVASTRRRFQAGRGPDGEAWVKGRKESGQTLIDSGLLLRSVQDRAPTDDAVEWGSNLVYAAIHQTGGTIKPVNGTVLRFKIGGGWVSVKSVEIPKRPYLGASAADHVAWSQILLRYVAEPIDEAAS